MLKRYQVLIVILFLAVGYASITTKCIIDGDTNNTFDNNNFIVSIK